MDISFKEMNNIYLKDVLDIYTYYVLNSTATFHAHGLSLQEMKELTFFDNSLYRTYVIFADNELSGYVILTQHKKREAYNGTAEVTIYLKQEYTGLGIGSRAIKFIEEYAISKRIHVLIATICGDNISSINLFSHNGYEKCAHYKEVGRKFGQLLDVVAYQKILY